MPGWHAPAVHVAPPQSWPHLPQFVPLVATSTQLPLHAITVLPPSHTSGASIATSFVVTSLVTTSCLSPPSVPPPSFGTTLSPTHAARSALVRKIHRIIGPIY